MILDAILKCITNLSGIPAIIAGRKLRPAMWYCALMSFIFDINGLVLQAAKVHGRLNSNLFFLMEFSIISVYFIEGVFPAKFRKLAYILAVGVATYFIVSTFMKDLQVGNYTDAALLYGIYIFYCLCGLYKVISEIEFIMVERNPLFIFSVAILLYASGSFVIFLFEHVMLHPLGKLVDDLWVYVHNVLNIVKNLLIAYGLVLMNRKKWSHLS